jgi:disulfide bond formation protein DsbB
MLTKVQNCNRFLLAGLGSGVLLSGAFIFQSAGYSACELCVLERWPHAIAAFLGIYISIGVFIHDNEYPNSARPARLEVGIAILGSIAMLTSIGLAMIHVGVELQLRVSPISCSNESVQALIGNPSDSLFPSLHPSHVPSCNIIIWTFLGLSIAAWNAIVSIVLATIWISTLVRWVTRDLQPIDLVQ